jgi:hypothetical protein
MGQHGQQQQQQQQRQQASATKIAASCNYGCGCWWLNLLAMVMMWLVAALHCAAAMPGVGATANV